MPAPTTTRWLGQSRYWRDNRRATIDVTTIDDSILEDTESVTITLVSITGDSDISIGTIDSATVSITDDDTAVVSIVASDPNASEPGDNGQFTVLISNPSDSDTTINYTVSGSASSGADFAPVGGSVVIAAGSTSATIDITVIEDVLVEAPESVTVTIDSITAGDSDIDSRRSQLGDRHDFG